MPFRRILLVKPAGRSGLSFLMDQIPLGLEYIAAYIEDAVDEASIVDMEMNHRSFESILDTFLPDLLGVTMSATEHNEGLRLAKIAKKRKREGERWVRQTGRSTSQDQGSKPPVPSIAIAKEKMPISARGQTRRSARSPTAKPTSTIGPT